MVEAQFSPVTPDHSSETTRPVAVNLETDSAGNLKTVSGGTGATSTEVQGNIASGATDSGKPVKTGGVFLTTKPTVTNGQRVDSQSTNRGFQIVQPSLEAGFTAGAAASGNIAAFADGGGSARLVAGVPYLYNGTTSDPARNNVEAILLASAARTATTSSADQVNYNGKGVIIVVNVTVEGAATLTLTVQGKDPISGLYYDIITGIIVYTAATDAPTITRAVHLYPGLITADFIGIAATVNGSTAKAVTLPRTWRATVTPADATTTTYSLSSVTLAV